MILSLVIETLPVTSISLPRFTAETLLIDNEESGVALVPLLPEIVDVWLNVTAAFDLPPAFKISIEVMMSVVLPLKTSDPPSLVPTLRPLLNEIYTVSSLAVCVIVSTPPVRS